jgi:exonuclease SbcC
MTWKCSDMRVESVTAVAFGPLRNATLEFGPQLTVIYGPNEAGKSSWHDGIYAAICGMRRGKGQPRTEDRDFSYRRRPWNGNDWEVRTVLRLDAGRRVELRQNLADLAHCQATDADLGRDVSGEILNEGTPDAAKWLGLDRESFLSVACVRQTEVQHVLDNAMSLQDELQRAAASVGRDATAAEAIARMEEFQRENVGQDRAHSTKPLHTAKVRLAAAELRLVSVRERHSSWLTTEALALDLRRKTNEAERRLRLFEAVRARQEALTWHAKFERARDLTLKYPAGQPGGLPDDEALAGDVAAALSEWENKPEVPILSGESAASVRAEIDALPSMPSGDQAPATEIIHLKKSFDRATHALELHKAQRPPEIEISVAKRLTPDELRELARVLDTPIPTVDSLREGEYSDAKSRLAASQRSSNFRPLVVGLAVAAVLGGAGLWRFGSHIMGSAIVISAVAALVWLVFHSADAGHTEALERLRVVETQLLPQRQAIEDKTERLKAARAEIAKLDLPLDSKALREMADELVLAEGRRQNLAEWYRNDEVLRSEVNRLSKVLGPALQQQGIKGLTDLDEAYAEYERTCQLRAEQATRAAKRQPLERQFAAQESAEQSARETDVRRSSARQRVLDTSKRCGQGVQDVELAIGELRRWQVVRKDRLFSFEQASREYAELRALLAGGTLDDLEKQNVERQRQSVALGAEFDVLPEIHSAGEVKDEVKRCEKLVHDASHDATAAETRARERANEVPSVAEAEEALISAQGESERVIRLSRTLELALEFLRTAEDRVHRDIAPMLAAALRQWLPAVTRGRYTDARVDPSNLNVQVLGPDKRNGVIRETSRFVQ